MVRKESLHWYWVGVSAAFAGVLALGVSSPLAAEVLPHTLRREGAEVVQVLEPLRRVLQTSSAVIYAKSRPLCFGTIVSPDGYLLTKASELRGKKKLKIVINQEYFEEFEEVWVDKSWDLVLLKVDAEDLIPVEWARSESDYGSVVIANDATSRSRRRAQWGVVSANSHEVSEKGTGYMGLHLKSAQDPAGLTVEKVTKGSAAMKAGIEKSDLITKIQGQEISDLRDLKKFMKEQKPGDLIDLEIMRSGKTRLLKLELQEKFTRNDSMSGRYSARRKGFSKVLQHDITLMNRTVGGPLLNLNGECVGVNIAGANRCESYAIPAGEIQALLKAKCP